MAAGPAGSWRAWGVPVWGDPALRGLSLGSAPLVLALPQSQREGAEEPQIEVGCALGPVLVL